MSEVSLEEPLCEGDGPFRPNVAALIVRKCGNSPEILLGEREDTPGCWQWPQGGLDQSELPEEGLKRELREEIGVREPIIRYRFPFALRYRFPVRLAKKFKPNIGQQQIYFIVGLSEGDQPDLKRADSGEFTQLSWRPIELAMGAVVWFKRDVYRAALDHARQVLPKLDY